MTSEKPRRRWLRPRFSLTTLLIVVTAICCWLGYSLNWIKERKAFFDARKDGSGHMLQYGVPDGKISAPNLLWLFGEQGRSLVIMWIEGQSAESLTAWDRERISQARRLFPETRIALTRTFEPDLNANTPRMVGYWELDP